MNKLRVIDLLNKIANGEDVPKEIKYNACLFVFERQSQDYYCEEYGNLFEYLINEHRTGEFLNDEVEVIEEDKKIERIGENNYKWHYAYDRKTPQAVVDNLELIRQKINEITDYINKGE